MKKNMEIMITDRIKEYSKEMPKELRLLVEGAPKDDLDWAIVMYLFRYSGQTKEIRTPPLSNVITLGKISNFFQVDNDIIFEKLNNMSILWVMQYLNSEGYGKTYYTYQITDFAADFLIKLVELLKVRVKGLK